MPTSAFDNSAILHALLPTLDPKRVVLSQVGYNQKVRSQLWRQPQLARPGELIRDRFDKGVSCRIGGVQVIVDRNYGLISLSEIGLSARSVQAVEEVVSFFQGNVPVDLPVATRFHDKGPPNTPTIGPDETSTSVGGVSVICAMT